MRGRRRRPAGRARRSCRTSRWWRSPPSGPAPCRCWPRAGPGPQRDRATEPDLTVSAAAMRVAADRWPEGAVVAVGNAPTALAEVIALAGRGTVRPGAGHRPAGRLRRRRRGQGGAAGQRPARHLERGRAGRQRGGRRRPQRPVAAQPRRPGHDARRCVHLVGAGPGDPLLLTRRAARLLAEADVVVADRPSTDAVAALAPPGAERCYVGRTPDGDAWPLRRVVDLLEAHARAGRRVVRLKSGDLFVCSRAGRGGRGAGRPRGAGHDHARGLVGHGRPAGRRGRPAARHPGHDRVRRRRPRGRAGGVGGAGRPRLDAGRADRAGPPADDRPPPDGGGGCRPRRRPASSTPPGGRAPRWRRPTLPASAAPGCRRPRRWSSAR